MRTRSGALRKILRKASRGAAPRRRLGIPLEKVKQILSFRDNDIVVALLMEYQQEALRLSRYYQKVAEDIDWYGRENEYIKLKSPDTL